MMKSLVPYAFVLIAAAAIGWAAGTTTSQTAPRVAPESLLPKSAFAAVHFDGSQRHQPAIQKTAAWQALEETQLRTRMFQLIEMGVSMADPALGQPIRQAIEHVLQYGISAAASVGIRAEELQPFAVVVLPDAAEVFQPIERAVRTFAERQHTAIEEKAVRGRRVSVISIQPTGIELGWWQESDHVVIAVGVQAVDQVIETAESPEQGIIQNAHWKRLRTSEKFEVTNFAWIDGESLINRFGDEVLPDRSERSPTTIRQLLQALGFENFRNFTIQEGFDDTKTWSTAQLRTDGELHGLLALLKQKPLTISELPPLPADTSAFAATRFDLSNAVDAVVETVRNVASLAGDDADEELSEAAAKLQAIFGGDPRSRLIPGFGDVWCVYGDTAQLPIPIAAAPVVCVSVGQRDLLLNGINALSGYIEREGAADDVSVRQSWKDGNLYVSLRLGEIPFLVPTMLVTEKWLVLSLTPGSAQSFVLREKGKLKSWKPNDTVVAALDELPQEFSAISLTDPAPGYRQLLTFAPMGISFLENNELPGVPPGTIRLPFGIEDIPSADAVTAPMFPNVSIAGMGEEGWYTTSRQSVPSTPLGGLSSAGAPVMIALLLPAVQQAREAARRTQSMNNLKQLAIAMHNYHDAFRKFPEGTVPNSNLPPNERLSWVVPLLPFIEHPEMYNALQPHFMESWQSPSLAAIRGQTLPVLQNASMNRQQASPSSMDYVGIAGVGPDAAMLPITDGKAGMFGYDRVVRMRDISDGTSNTVMIGQSSTPNQSFLAGGRETIRGFSQKPYLNGPDQIGSPHTGIVQFALADGSVRSISVNIDPAVLEALATIRGAEVIGDF